MVISTMGIPPASMASTASSACCELLARTTGTMPISPIRFMIRSEVMASELLREKSRFRAPARRTETSARDAGGLSFHQVLHVLPGGHGCVAGRGHGQGPVRGAAFKRPLHLLSGEKSIQQTRRKGVAAAHTVKDFQILSCGGFVKLAGAVRGYGTPVVAAGGVSAAQGYGDQRNVGEGLANRLHHGPETGRIELVQIFVHTRHRKSERYRKVLLVADEHIHQGCQPAVHFLRFAFPADGLPEGRAIIQVVGNAGA